MAGVMSASAPGGPSPTGVLARELAPNTFSLRRVVAERLVLGHFPALRTMDENARMMSSLGGTRTEAETEAYLQRNLTHWTEHGFGVWLLRDPASDRLMGRAGLRHIEVGGLVEVELACALLPEFWGVGLGTEISRACVTIGREWLGLPSLVALPGSDNLAAHRVLLKSAFGPEREIRHADRPRILFRTD
jgi:RimJ/RimL family protein N-acetyltransferase